MKKQTVRYTLLTALVIGMMLLSACGGTAPASNDNSGLKVLAKEVVFTGVIEAISGDQITVSGQVVTLDPSASVDPNLAVGVIVKVEGTLNEDGSVIALKIETSAVSDDNSNDDNGNDDNSNDDNGNDDNSNDDNGNDDNSNDDNGNDSDDDGESETIGTVSAIGTDSVTVDGVTYQFSSDTEIKDAIMVGDQVKIHFSVDAGGNFMVREIEKLSGDDDGDDNGNDDNSNDDNGNDDNSNDDNGNDDNSNDDNGNDDNSNGGNSGSGGNDNDDNDNDDDDDDDNDNDDNSNG